MFNLVARTKSQNGTDADRGQGCSKCGRQAEEIMASHDGDIAVRMMESCIRRISQMMEIEVIFYSRARSDFVRESSGTRRKPIFSSHLKQSGTPALSPDGQGVYLPARRYMQSPSRHSFSCTPRLATRCPGQNTSNTHRRRSPLTQIRTYSADGVEYTEWQRTCPFCSRHPLRTWLAMPQSATSPRPPRSRSPLLS